MLDAQAAGMEVELAADRAGQERGLSAILAIAHDRVADGRHVDAQLVGAAGERLKLDPGGAIARTVDHAIAGARGQAVLAFVDHHLFAARARLLGQRQFDHAVADFGNAHDQRPVDLARGAARESLGEEGRAARRARDEQDARGVLVETVDEAGARVAVVGIGIEQAVDVFVGAAAALRGKAGRLVDDDGRAILFENDILGQMNLFFGQRLAHPGALAPACERKRPASGRHAQHLAGREARVDIGALAIDADLAGAGPARDHRETDLGKVALEPAVEAHIVVVGLDGKLAHGIGRAADAGAAAGVFARAVRGFERSHGRAHKTFARKMHDIACLLSPESLVAPPVRAASVRSRPVLCS
jgi:hypothetical protein